MTRRPARRLCGRVEQSDATYFLLDGRTVASRVEEGAVRVLEVHNAGDFFGEIAALTGMPRTASVLADAADDACCRCRQPRCGSLRVTHRSTGYS